ncbi:hypothetical protein DL98DRAFT_657554 [Cadophora sp. DSE1049]|nr:hypothetical protein DL98DRAFT_657554 [Cadophora sp. DSE1049]
MSTPNCVSCQERLSCDDSLLSVTGNIIGILTFAGALFISIQVYAHSMRNAEWTLREMRATLESRYEEVEHLMRKLEAQDRHHIEENLRRRLVIALDQARGPLHAIGTLLQELDSRNYDGGKKLWLRAKFIQREEMIKDGLAKTESAIGTLGPEPTEHELAFRCDIMQQLAGVSSELQGIRPIPRFQEIIPSEGALPHYVEDQSQIGNSNIPPDAPGLDAAFRGEVLQHLVEVRNELKNLKETNAKVLREMQDMLRKALSRALPEVKP